MRSHSVSSLRSEEGSRRRTPPPSPPLKWEGGLWSKVFAVECSSPKSKTPSHRPPSHFRGGDGGGVLRLLPSPLRIGVLHLLVLLPFLFATGCKDKPADTPQPKVEKQDDAPPPKGENPGKLTEPHESAEVAYRRYLAGLESGKKEQQVAALDAVLPYRKDMDKLLPKYSKHWGMIDQDRKEDLEDYQRIAEDATRGGPIIQLKMIDIRSGPLEATAPYKLVLSVLDPTALIVEFEVDRKNRKTIDQGWVYVYQRWIKIDDILNLVREMESKKD